jgi:hypothetical protein
MVRSPWLKLYVEFDSPHNRLWDEVEDRKYLRETDHKIEMFFKFREWLLLRAEL